jgi:hypothetical protein
VNPAYIGNRYVWAKRWKIGDFVDAVSQGLYLSETGGVIYQAIVCHRFKRQQCVGRGQIRVGLAMMADNSSVMLGKRALMSSEYLCLTFSPCVRMMSTFVITLPIIILAYFAMRL